MSSPPSTPTSGGTSLHLGRSARHWFSETRPYCPSWAADPPDSWSLSQQMADLLRQRPIAETPTWDAHLGCRGAMGRSSCPHLLRRPRRGPPVGQVVRLPGGMMTLEDAVDAFLDQHNLARSTRRVYRVSLASRGRRARPGDRGWRAVRPEGRRLVSRRHARRRRPPGTGSWPPCGLQSAGGAAAAGWPWIRPMLWHVAASGSTAPRPSPAASS